MWQYIKERWGVVVCLAKMHYSDITGKPVFLGRHLTYNPVKPRG